MQLKEILLGVPVICFIFWLFTAPLPADRIERACEPIHWVGNLATSTTALSVDSHTGTAARWSDKLNYSCQYLIWRLFYQESYNKAVEAGRVKVEGNEVKVLEGADADKAEPKEEPIPGAEPPQNPDVSDDAEKAPRKAKESEKRK